MIFHRCDTMGASMLGTNSIGPMTLGPMPYQDKRAPGPPELERDCIATNMVEIHAVPEARRSDSAVVSSPAHPPTWRGGYRAGQIHGVEERHERHRHQRQQGRRMRA